MIELTNNGKTVAITESIIYGLLISGGQNGEN